MTATVRLNSVRANESFVAMTTLLDEHGVPWSVESGSKHPKIVFDVGGRRYVHPFSKSCVDKMAAIRSAADIRRIVKSALTTPEPAMSRSIHVLDTDLNVVEYRGQRVVTFAQVDRVHQRPDGTAGRAFRDNRARFVEGEDFFELSADEIRRQTQTGVFAAHTRNATFLSRRGYLKLTKSLTDDRAWAVQGEMVDRYFAIEEMAKALAAPGSADDKVDRALGIAKSTIHKVTGIERDVADVKAGNDLALEAITKLRDRVDAIALAKPVLSFDPSMTVTAHQIVEMAGVATADRQRGTTQIVTSRMLEFCLERGVAPQRTPTDVNPGRPWRFPRALANEWLTGAEKGIEVIRSQIERRKAIKARSGLKTGQSALELVR